MEIKIMLRNSVVFNLFIIINLVYAQSRYNAAVKGENEVEEQGKPLKIKSQKTADFFTTKLVDNPTCSEDIKRLCGNDVHNLNNFAVLECIQNEERDDSALISDDCHHVLWTYKYDLTHSSQIEDLARGYCKDDIDVFNECSSGEGGYGNTISCLIQNFNKVEKDKCRQYVIRLGTIIFSDYHLVQHVTEACKEDIEKHLCGRVQTGADKEPHSQGLTIECLSKHTDELGEECKVQIFKLAELQSEDFHLDRAFYFACREDRDKFCKDVRAGQGKVYKCLFQHRKERTMSQDCADQLTNRRNLIVRDYKVSKTLVKACREAIKENQCRKSINKDEEAVIKLPKILRCLESALRKGKIGDGECKEEIIAHRQTIFEMSPSLIENCKPELLELCSDVRGPNKLHCLLKYYVKRNKDKISPECRVAIEDVMKVSDPAEDWRVDPILHDACLPVVQSRCIGFKGGEGRIMRCLMRSLNSPQMTQDCEAALLEIQYFVARDWKLDPQLYHNCRIDAIKFCHAANDWTDPTSVQGADNSILVLPCLFRYAYHPSPNLRLTQECSQDVRRVMIERAAFVQLHPRIEMECLEPLVKFCSENTGPGEEMFCLQKNMEKLNGECLILIKNYTEAEVKDVGLNSLVTTYCSEVINNLCSDVLQNSQMDEGNVMDCLIRNKNGQEIRTHYKCRAVIENFQIVMIKDISFTPKFKQECHKSVKQYCSGLTNRKEILDCLADRILKDVLNDDRFSISKGCRQQVRKQLAQRHENIAFDSDLRKYCENNINEFCEDQSAPGMVLECLRKNRKSLDDECHQIVFKREETESLDPSTDVVLMQSCRQMIKLFCANEEPSQIFTCLKNQRDNSDFDLKCRTVVMRRMIERSHDISLNPDLYKACIHDAQMYCPNELLQKTEVERNGRVIECLKERLPEGKLSSTCKIKIIQITKSSALNYKLDPILVEKCEGDMKALCKSILVKDSENGEMEECLKRQLDQEKIADEQCKIHIAQIMQMERADIHADPLLYKSCQIDDRKFCGDLLRGEHLRCLFGVLDKNPNGLEEECRNKLSERREMYKVAVKLTKLETMDDIVEGVRSSPNRNFFLVILFTIVGIIFIVGLTCGRASRNYKLLKNR